MAKGLRNTSRHITIYLITLLFSNLSFAGSLLGDWFLESEVESESTVKSAFSLAQSNSQESINATLGIRGDEEIPIELYLVVSNEKNDASCQFDVVEAEIDSITLPLIGFPQVTEISNIKTTTNEQNRFWSLFREGKNLTIIVKKLCNSVPEFQDQHHSFNFSLKGSGAAFEFIAPKGLIPPRRKAQDPQEQLIKSKETFRISENDENSSNHLNLLFFFVIAIILIFWTTLRRKSRKARETTVQIKPSVIVDDFILHSSENETPLHADGFKHPRAEKTILIEGQLETLKKLKKALSEKGITRFTSIADINSFVHGYENEIRIIPNIVRTSFEDEYQKLSSDVSQLQQQYEKLKTTINEEINQEIQNLGDEITLLRKKCGNSFLKILFNYREKSRLKRKKTYLEDNSDQLLERKTNQIYQALNFKKNKLDELTSNKDKIINDRCNKSVKELSRIKDVIDGLYPVIAGAIGENVVLNTLSGLADDFYLINDFSMKFDPPIYNKKEDDRIYSVQIDHLLICRSGVFVLETKNWSEKSLKNIDLRSPVQQVLRTSHALFVLLNGESGFSEFGLDHHHWGNKKIPIRSVIVMTNAKPTQEFKFVKIVPVDQLVGYVKYFKDVLSSSETNNLFTYLRKKNI